MIVYSIATIISIFLGYIVQRLKKQTIKEKNVVLVFSILAIMPLFLVMALRYDVGTDYMNTYRARFLNRIYGADLSKIFEIGFIKLIDLILIFTKNPQWIFIICAWIFCYFTFKAIYQQSNNFAYSILILVIGNHFFGAMNLMRNYIALAIVLYAFKFVRDRNFMKYFFWVIIASTIHKTVIIFLPYYFLYGVKLSRKKIILIIIVTTIGLPILGNVTRYMIEHYTDYYWYYDIKRNALVPQYTDIFTNLMLMGIGLYYYKEEAKNDSKYTIYIWSELICLLVAFSSFYVPMIRRVILLPIFLQIIYIPYLTKYEKNKKIKLLINLAICILLFTITIKRVCISGMHEVLPYQTIFSKGI